jgi:hypothetical protein
MVKMIGTIFKKVLKRSFITPKSVKLSTFTSSFTNASEPAEKSLSSANMP